MRTGDVVNLETIIERLHPKFVEDAFSAAGGAGVVEASWLSYSTTGSCEVLSALVPEYP